MSVLSKNVIKYRTVRDWSQSELARRAGVTSACISKIEGGHDGLTVDIAMKISKVFNVTIDTLFRNGKILIDDRDLFCSEFSYLAKLNKSDQALIIGIAKRLSK